MKKEELESITAEVFRELDLGEQQHLLGQYTRLASSTSTYTPNAGADADFDMVIDWS